MTSDGKSVRTYTYIADAIKAMFLVLLKSNDIVYNISDEKSETTIKGLAETLLSLKQDRKLKLVYAISSEASKGCASFTKGILSSEKIRNELNWIPKYHLQEGFARTFIHLEEEIQNSN